MSASVVLAAETARLGAESARTGAETARDIALAGQFLGADLGTGDLNAITTPGMYAQTNGGNALTSRNYPRNGIACALAVERWGGNGQVIQRLTPYPDGTPYRVHGVFIRSFRGSWSPWSFLSEQNVDQTAGRAIYTWDDLNWRPQLVYGDTGWRRFNDSAGTLLNGVTGYLDLRRDARTIWMRGSLTPPAVLGAGEYVLAVLPREVVNG